MDVLVFAFAVRSKRKGSFPRVRITSFFMFNKRFINHYLYLGKCSRRQLDDTFFFFFFFFSRKTGSDIPCKLSPQETICMKCQSLLFGKNKKDISKCRLLIFYAAYQAFRINLDTVVKKIFGKHINYTLTQYFCSSVPLDDLFHLTYYVRERHTYAYTRTHAYAQREKKNTWEHTQQNLDSNHSCSRRHFVVVISSNSSKHFQRK